MLNKTQNNWLNNSAVLVIDKEYLKNLTLSNGKEHLFLFPDLTREEIKENSNNEIPKPKQDLLVDYEEMIREIEIRYESDSTILIKGPTKSGFSFHCGQLGFRDSNLKTWKFFNEILTYPRDGFNFGTAYLYPEKNERIKNKSYDSRWRLCDELCKKLVIFFNKEFNWALPKTFKLYEKFEPSNDGKYRFKFKIGKPVAEESNIIFSGKVKNKMNEQFKEYYRKFSEPQLALELQRLSNDYDLESNKEEMIPEKLLIAYEIGNTMYGWSQDTVRKLLME